MTVKEIAEAYDISTSTVRQRINAGKLRVKLLLQQRRSNLIGKPVHMHGFLFYKFTCLF